MVKEILPKMVSKMVSSSGGLSENNEEKCYSQVFTSIGLEREQDDEVNFDTLLHSSFGGFRI